MSYCPSDYSPSEYYFCHGITAPSVLCGIAIDVNSIVLCLFLLRFPINFVLLILEVFLSYA